MSSTKSFTYSYMITNRAYSAQEFVDIPLDTSGRMYFTMGPAFDTDSTQYQIQNLNDMASTTMPATFQTALINDLGQAQVNGAPQLTVYIHGLGDEWSDAVDETAEFGNNLAMLGGYTGLVIGFSWPSYGELDSAAHYATKWPPTAKNLTIRDNIVNSINAFSTLINMVQTLKQTLSNLSFNIICHSEGNYMLMQGMSAQTSKSKLVQHVIMLAADITNAALQLEPASNANVNGMAIASLSNDVSVYSSLYDEDLLYSNVGFLTFHNPNFPLRLGQAGIYSYQGGAGVQPLPDNVIGIDCSLVVNDQNIINLANQGSVTLLQMPLAETGTFQPFIHSSYRYIPQVLQDMTAAMVGQKPVDRTPVNGTNGQGFQMTVAPAAKAAAQAQR